MKSLNDFLPPNGCSQLTDGEALDILFDIENQDALTNEQKFDFMRTFLMLLIDKN